MYEQSQHCSNSEGISMNKSERTDAKNGKGIYKKEFVVDLESGLLMEIKNVEVSENFGDGNTVFQSQESITGLHIPLMAKNVSVYSFK